MQGANMDSNTNLTDKEKLEKIKDIIENNLHPIFTSFTLDLTLYPEGNKLEKFVELKELLNITSGSINKKEAIKYDNFKSSKKYLYDNLMSKLDDRMIKMRNNKEKSCYYDNNLSSYMFMSSFYSIFCHDISVDMTDKDYNEMIENIKHYNFISG
jgi:hypothetical protein